MKTTISFVELFSAAVLIISVFIFARARPYLTARAKATPLFWKVGSGFNRTRFEVQKRAFGFTLGLAYGGTVGAVLWRFLKGVVKRIILPVFLLVLGLFVDQALHSQGQYLNRIGIRLPGLQQTYINTAASAILQLAVVVLGLYFAALSVVASTQYSQVPTNLRSLFLKEVGSRTFLRSTASAATYAALVLLTQIVGIGAGYCSCLILIGLAVYAIETFVLVGPRIFLFFDPSNLLQILGSDFRNAVLGAVAGSFAWRDASFQDLRRRNADAALNSFNSLAQLAERPEATLQLANFGLNIFGFYAERKRDIPSDSSWFEKRNSFPDWLVADSIELSLAINTRTRVKPKEVRVTNWFETRLTATLAFLTRRIFNTLDEAKTTKAIEMVSDTLKRSSSALAIDESLQLARDVVAEYVKSVETVAETKEVRSWYVFGDSIGYLATNLILGLRHRIDLISSETIDSLVAARLHNRRSPNDVWIPFEVYEKLTQFESQWRFERAVSGIVETPFGYTKQLLTATLLESLWASIGKCKTFVQTDLVPYVSRLSAQGREISSLSLATRLHETVQKLDGLYEAFDALRKRLGDFPALDPDEQLQISLTTESDEIFALDQQLLRLMIDALGRREIIAYTDDIPDLFGQTYHIVFHDALGALAKGDRENFIAIATACPALTLASMGRITAGLSHDPLALVEWIHQPVADLLDLCGYAIIYSSLDSKDYWTPLRDALDAALSSYTSERLGAFAGLALRLSSKTMPHAFLRQELLQSLEQRLEKARLVRKRFDGSGVRGAIVVSKNKTIAILCDGGYLHATAREVACAFYFLRRRGASMNRLPSSAVRLLARRSRNAG